MIKKRIYLDATIPNYMFDARESLKVFVEFTQKWWQEERQRYEIWASEETLHEVGTGEYPHKAQAIELASHIPLLPLESEIIEIAQVYIDHYVMPLTLKGDALHLAYASFYKMDFLLTWNWNHLANANKKQHIVVINTRLQLSIPEIITPLQLFHEENV
jgi:hypothetical protein